MSEKTIGTSYFDCYPDREYIEVGNSTTGTGDGGQAIAFGDMRGGVDVSDLSQRQRDILAWMVGKNSYPWGSASSDNHLLAHAFVAIAHEMKLGAD